MKRADRSHLPEVGPDPPFSPPAVVRHRLANGLDVRTVEHHGVPVVVIALQVRSGTVSDPPGREGLAALVADMIDEGTGAMSALDVSEAIAQLGAEYEVDVGPDATVFSLMTLSRLAERGANLLARMTTAPALHEADVVRVRQLRRDRVRQLRDLPAALAERAFLRLLYGDHPYGHLSIGSEPSLARITSPDVVAFHERGFRPDNAVLVVCGALPHDRMYRLAEDAFGGWVARAGPRTETLPGDPAAAAAVRLAIVAREGAAQSELRIGQLSARRGTPDYHRLLVMNAVLGGQFVSRINLKLREEKGYTYGARTGFDWRLGPAPFALQASVDTAATADAIRDVLDEFEAIRGARPPAAEELALARASLTRGYARGFETAQQVARSVIQLALFGLPDTYFSEFVPAVNAVTEADVTDAAVRHVDPSRMVTLVVGDRTAVEGPLAALGLGVPELLPAEI